MPDDFNAGPNDVWKDDDAFKNLAKKPGLILHKLSYHCASMDCPQCDGKISYHFNKFSHREYNAKTGEEKEVWEDFHWDFNHASVQLHESPGIQTPFNTPEGSKCECFCHTKPAYKQMIEGTTSPSPQPIGRMIISQYDQKDLDPGLAEKLR